MYIASFNYTFSFYLVRHFFSFVFFFFNATATTEIYTLSLHDALPISIRLAALLSAICAMAGYFSSKCVPSASNRSEEHTSELQSRFDLVCRLLLEKKKKKVTEQTPETSHTPQHTNFIC